MYIIRVVTIPACIRSSTIRRVIGYCLDPAQFEQTIIAIDVRKYEEEEEEIVVCVPQKNGTR